MCLQGGYKTQTIMQIGNLFSALTSEKISFRGVRLYFASLVIVAAREAAKRSRMQTKRRGDLVVPRYLFKELSRLTGCPLSRIRGELRSLERAGLLLFSETEISFTESALPGSLDLTGELAGGRSPMRPIPFPRPVLRYLAGCRRVATCMTMIAYCLRGLTISREGEVAGKGTAKASWIGEVTGLSIRAVRSARAGLIELGFIADDEGSNQWKLNRDGAYFSINLSWEKQPRVIHSGGERRDIQQSRSEAPAVDNSCPQCSSFAPPAVQNCSSFAPPYKDKKTSSNEELKNQKTRTCGGEQTGKSGFYTKKIKRPVLKDIHQEDLRRVSSLEILYRQALKAKWLEPSEANFQNFVAAAARATRINGDSVRVFVAIVKGKLWHHITAEQEERAREVIKIYREKIWASETQLVRSASSPMRVGNLLAELSFKVGLGEGEVP